MLLTRLTEEDEDSIADNDSDDDEQSLANPQASPPIDDADHSQATSGNRLVDSNSNKYWVKPKACWRILY